MANPTVLTWSVKSDAAILADLQDLGLSIGVTSYSSSTGQIGFSDTPLQSDVDQIISYFAGFGDHQLQ